MAYEGYCCECKAPIDTTRMPWTRIDGKDACAVCFEMTSVVGDRAFFVKAELDFQERKKYFDGLRPGNTEK